MHLCYLCALKSSNPRVHISCITFVLATWQLNFVDVHDCSIENQCKALYARGNTLLRHFRNCSDDVRKLLFNSYCTSFYGSSLWCNFKCNTISCLKTAHNRIFRLLFNISGQVSISQCLLSRKLHPFKVLLRKSILSLRTRLFNSVNHIVNVVSNSLFSMNCRLHRRWNNFLHKL